jgi:hypothetical protein
VGEPDHHVQPRNGVVSIRGRAVPVVAGAD